MSLRKNSAKGVFMILLISALLFASGCTAEEQELDKAEDMDTPIGFSNFQTQDIYGTKIDSSVFNAHILTMINVWGTFCGPCIEEMPDLGELQNEYEQKGFNIVGIVVDVQDRDLEVLDEEIGLAREIAEATGADYTHLIVSEEMIDTVLYQFDSIPTSFFVDSDGNIVSEFYVGAREKAKWAEIIEENLENL